MLNTQYISWKKGRMLNEQICICYNYRDKDQILYSQEYLDYTCIIKNTFIYSCTICLLLEDIKFPLFIVLIPFFSNK